MSHLLVLASESPRRKDLLMKAGFFFHVFSVKVSESLKKNLTLDQQIIDVAERKAAAAIELYKPLESQDYLFLSADTMVILDQTALGKPENEKQARQFLEDLSGRSHQVKTAVHLVICRTQTKDQRLILKHVESRSAIETTEVHFKHLSLDQISEYITSGEPMDKAGAYGIQGLGGQFVEKFVGPFDNVVGLPVDTVKKLISEMKINISRLISVIYK